MDYGINTYNNFLLSIPKKQAKSYEIDLGQNNGAYDEELLIRYGDNTLNHMKNKNRCVLSKKGKHQKKVNCHMLKYVME